MPKDEFWISLLTTLVILHQTMSATNTTKLIGAVGGSVTFLIQDTSGGDAAVWSFGNEYIMTALFVDPPQAVFSKQAFKKHFAVSEKGRALSISQLRLEDAGTYSVTIGKKTSTFILRVYRELAEPTVTCEAQNCSSNGSCRFSLRCSVSGTDLGNVSYTWREGDRLWNEGPKLLVVNKSDLERLGPLTCTARNPVSSRNVTVITPNVFCTETSTDPPGLGSLSGSRVAIGVIAWFGVVALLLVFLLLFFRKSKGWTKFRLFQLKPTDPASTSKHTTMHAEVGPSQQHIPNGIKAKPTDGESTTTIYSMVKRPDQLSWDTPGCSGP